MHHGVWAVDDVDNERAGGLRSGDQLLSINGKPLRWLGPQLPLASVRSGQFYTLSIRRGDSTPTLHLRVGSNEDISLLDVGATLTIASLLVLAGLWMWLGGPDNTTARLGSIAFLLAGIAMIAPVLQTYHGWTPFTVWAALILSRITRPMQMVFGWDFLSQFPHPVPEGKFVHGIRLSLYTIGILLWSAGNFPVFAQLFGLPHIQLFHLLEWATPEGPLNTQAMGFLDVAVSAGVCYVLIRNYRLLADRDSRSKIRLAAASFGLAAACLLMLRLLEAGLTLWGVSALEMPARYADVMTTVAVGVIPITLSYAVVRHRLLGIRLVIRRGLQYLLAKNVLRLIIFAPALIVLMHIIREPNQSIYDLVFRSSWSFYLLVMGTAAFSLRYRRQLTKWLDRRFFRDALQEEEAWLGFAEALTAANSEEEVANSVARQMEMAFHAQGIHVLLRSPHDGRLRPAFSRLDRNAHRLCKRFEESSIGVLASNSVVALTETDSAFADPERGEEELLVVPLLGSDARNMGAFVLGPKKSEQPYTRKERELLQAVAAQVVMACEVLRLKRSVDQESRQRIAVLGRLDRESIQLLNECFTCGNCYDASMQRCPADGTPLELSLPVERVVVGRYRLDRRLGAGGMGVVYRALDIRLDKTVAVKIMTGELFGNRQALLRFKREAQAVASLTHPNIVGVHDFGQFPAGGAFLVMDLVNGLSWRKHLQRSHTLDPERVAGWIEDLCSGVGAAHKAKLVHRDLKPENVVISADGERETAMILDFGLAKLHAEGEAASLKLSATGMVIGTRCYMSPEQRAGQTVGIASDIYSIAVMTLETLSRWQPPNSGASRDWAVTSLERISRPHSCVRQVFESALDENPETRMRDAEHFGKQLAAAIRLERPVVAAVLGSDDTETLSFDAAN